MPHRPKKITVSCFIIAKNEEKRIARTILSVLDLVDEIIVIDSGSSDKTEQICRSLGVTFLENDWHGYGPQKRFGEEQCQHDWVLNLDADEVLSAELQSEIRSLFAAQSLVADGYHLTVVDVLPNRLKPLPLARKYNIVRLYNRRKMRYSDSPVHDRVVVDGHVLGQLNRLVYHFSAQSISQAIRKANDYSDLQAKTMKSRNIWLLRLRMITEFPTQFFRYYILQGYFMGGLQGLSFSMIYASFRFFRIAKILEKRQQKKE